MNTKICGFCLGNKQIEMFDEITLCFVCQGMGWIHESEEEVQHKLIECVDKMFSWDELAKEKYVDEGIRMSKLGIASDTIIDILETLLYAATEECAAIIENENERISYDRNELYKFCSADEYFVDIAIGMVEDILETKISKSQISSIADWIQDAVENSNLRTGSSNIPNPLKTENERLKKELEKERNKVTCDECGGRGYSVISYGTLSSESQCFKCKGKGKV